MYFYRSIFGALSASVISFGLMGCGSDHASKGAAAEAAAVYQVVCTVGMITDLVSHVAGPRATVEGIIGEGVDPHLYKPTRADVVALDGADIVFYNGLLLEGKMTDVLVRVAGAGKLVQAVTEGILDDSDYLLAKDDGSESTDPHVWMDVQGWLAGLALIADTLSEYDPQGASEYASNAAAYAAELKALEAYAQEVMATIPESQRVLITAHDAFQYFGRAYGIEVRGIQGVSTESEAGVRDLEKLIEFIVERKIPSVFVESSVADKNVRALVEGAKARGHDVKIGGELFSDAMGKAGTYEGSYIGMMDHNVTTIANALGGIAEGFRNRHD